jgi:hypothetical protein
MAPWAYRVTFKDMDCLIEFSVVKATFVHLSAYDKQGPKTSAVPLGVTLFVGNNFQIFLCLVVPRQQLKVRHVVQQHLGADAGHADAGHAGTALSKAAWTASCAATAAANANFPSASHGWRAPKAALEHATSNVASFDSMINRGQFMGESSVFVFGHAKTSLSGVFAIF